MAAVVWSRWALPLMVDGKEMTPRQRSTRLIGMGGILPPLGFYLCAGFFGWPERRMHPTQLAREYPVANNLDAKAESEAAAVGYVVSRPGTRGGRRRVGLIFVPANHMEWGTLQHPEN